jgi:acyl-coenzyme A thioesterase PaaI-like protein
MLGTEAHTLATGTVPVNIPPHHDPACWGCGNNPTGIHLPVPTREGAARYEATFSFGEEHQAAPGLVHGGLVGAALDEACGLLATWYRFPSVTARFSIRFLQPVHINRRLKLAATLDGERGRRLEISATLADGNELLADARGSFVHVPLEHFLRTPEGRAARDAWRERLDAASGST